MTLRLGATSGTALASLGATLKNRQEAVLNLRFPHSCARVEFGLWPCF